MTITKPGVYDIPADVYHADPTPEPSLSSSIAKVLVGETPLHAWSKHPRLGKPAEEPEEAKFDIGKAAHSLVLQDPQAFEIVDAKDWKTDKAKALRAAARDAGKIPLLATQWVRVTAMAHAGRIQLDRHEEASAAFTNGKPEQTLIWREGPTWCRARLDYLPNAGNIFDDYKSTAASADPDAWSRNLFNLGFDMQAAFYLRGLKALKICDRPSFRFIVQETETPHALSVVGLMPGALELAQHKIARALDIWQTCLASGVWPAYPTRTCYVDAPAWHEAQFIERDQHMNDTLRRAAKPSAESLKRALEAQAPI